MDLTIISAPSDEWSTGIDERAHHDNRPLISQTEPPATHGAIQLIDGALSSLSTKPTTPAAVRFPKLLELTLNRIKLTPEHQMEQFILQSPMLHTLDLRLKSYKFSLDHFCDYFAAQTWPYLDSLAITGHYDEERAQQHIRLLQSTKRPFKLLDLDRGAIGPQSLDLLRQGGHFETLIKVDLTIWHMSRGCHRPMSVVVAASKRIREVLESCSSLEHIAGSAISGQDIIDSKPWVCHRLKKFEVLISMDLTKQKPRRAEYTKDEKRKCHQVFERLSQLRQLKVLDMSGNRCIYTTSITLPLELRMGLGHLSTLRNLELIGYQGRQRMRMVDVEWMLQHWTKFRMIAGGPPTEKQSKTFGGTNVRCYLFRKILMARKVDVPKEWKAYETNVEEYMKSNGLEDVYDTDDDGEGESEKSETDGAMI
jgi:hypothetical protein